MKLASYRHQNRDRFGAVDGDSVVDLTEASGHATLASFVGSPEYADRDALVARGGTRTPLSEVTLLPVIPQPEKIVCSVRNYMDHHQEALAAGLKRELSDFPPIFIRVWRSQVAHEAPPSCARTCPTASTGKASWP